MISVSATRPLLSVASHAEARVLLVLIVELVVEMADVVFDKSSFSNFISGEGDSALAALFFQFGFGHLKYYMYC